jgi:hypothetical protein
MTFQEAVKATPSVSGHLRQGLQALRKDHRKLTKISDSKQLDGSLNLDNALLRAKSNEPRWDYGVGLAIVHGSVRAVWIEFHPAASSHVGPVLAKFHWLCEWLRDEAPALNRLKARYVWVATGSVAFPANSRERRLLAKNGLMFRAKRLNLGGFAN